MKVPTSILVMAILGIIYGGMGAVSTPCTLAMASMQPQGNPMMDKLMANSLYKFNYYFGLSAHLVFSTMLLVGSILSLRLRPIGRKLVLTYAMAALVMAVLNTVLSFVLFPVVEEAVKVAPPSPVPMMPMMIGSMGCGIVLGFGIPAVLLYFYNRKIAKDAFAGIPYTEPRPFPVQPLDTDPERKEFP